MSAFDPKQTFTTNMKVASSYVKRHGAAIPIFDKRCRFLAYPFSTSMTADARDTRIAELEAEIKQLRRLLASAENRAADEALATAQRSIHHARELSAEREKTTSADLRSIVEGERADRAEVRAAGLDAVHKALFVDAEFNRQVLENTTDCITVLDLDGRLEFTNLGGMRVMEIDDFNPFRHCPWPECWQGEQRQKTP
jgi:hypothetical protein